MRDRIISGSGHIFYLEKGENWEWVKEVQLAINIPGTNTLQLALLKIPQITILPLQWAEYIPIEGIIEWMSKLPWIGKRIKRKIVYKIIPRIKFIAFPNMISREKITEELIGELTPKSIAQKILNLIRDKNKLIVMREKLSQIEFTRGASQKIARLVGEELYEQS
jgi:lipid-A-disaccharide synthase